MIALVSFADGLLSTVLIVVGIVVVIVGGSIGGER